MEILSADYFLAMFLTICVSVAGIFGPQAIEKQSGLSADRLSVMHCRIFGSCIFFGGIFLLFGGLDLIGTFSTVLAAEVLFFGFMYFVGLLANESDKARIAREKAQAERRAEEARAKAQAERRRQLQLDFEELCELTLDAYLQNVVLWFYDLTACSDCEKAPYDQELLREVEGWLAPHETLFWRGELLVAVQNPQAKASQARLETARGMVRRALYKRLFSDARVIACSDS